MKKNQTWRFRRKRWLSALAPGIIPTIIAMPANAAEKILFNYGPLLFEVEVSSIAKFADKGEIKGELAFYLKRLDKETRAALREALIKRHRVNAVELYHFFKTEMGEEMLEQMGNFVTIPGGRNGKYAIRAALGKAAFDKEEGLTVLNVLQQYPTDIYLNTDEIFQLAASIDTLIKEADRVVAKIKELSLQEALSDRIIDYSQLPDLRVRGTFGYIVQTLKLFDPRRGGRFQVDIYKPKTFRVGKTPVVLASHGLASNRKYFQKIAEHLASYGYVVAIPEHQNSNYTHFIEMLEGYNRNIFKVTEFIDRPKDISYLSDELEKRNPSEFQGKLDLENVGVLGHSFGAYTALALAGAQINFDQLEIDCNQGKASHNLSLLLQCRALELPRQNYNLRDLRVASVFVVNPVNSSIFGKNSLSKIEIPLMFAAGSDDPVTPVVIQIQSFTGLMGRDRYLLLLEGQTHLDISKLEVGATQLIESVTALKYPPPELIDRYERSIILAFFENYLTNNSQYNLYLKSSYTKYISEDPFGLYMVESTSSQNELKQTITKYNNLTNESFSSPRR